MKNIKITQWRQYSDTVAVQKVDHNNNVMETNFCNLSSEQLYVNHRRINNTKNASQINMCAFIVDYLMNSENAIPDNYQ
jgi:hypothetical protein